MEFKIKNYNTPASVLTGGAVLLAFFLTACGHQANQVKVLTPSERRANTQLEHAFRHVERLHFSGANRTAILATDDFLATYDDTRYAPQVKAYRGHLEQQRGELSEAISWYEKALEGREFLPPKFLYWTLLKKAQTELLQGDEDDAEKTVKDLDPAQLSPADQINLLEVRGQIALESNNPMGALSNVMDALKIQPRDIERLRPIWEKAIEVIKGAEPLLELHTLYVGGALSDRILFEAIMRLYAQGNETQGLSSANLFMRHYAKSPFAPQVRRSLEGDNPNLSESSKTVGLLVPKTGKWAELGTQVQKAVELGLDRRSSRLVVEDCGETEESMVEAFKRLVNEHRALVVLGPFFSKGSDAVAAQAEALRTPTLLLSKKDLAPNGYAFQFGLTQRQQAAALIQSIFKKKKTARFAIIGPRSPKGLADIASFWEAAESAGARISGFETYPPEQKDFQAIVAKLTGIQDLEGRKTWGATIAVPPPPKKKGKAPPPPKKTLPPIVDFDALWIADEAPKAATIIPTLRFLDASGVTFLGPAQWNSPKARQLFSGLQPDVWFADLISLSATNSAVRDFKRQFQTEVGFEPESQHALAYDAAVFLTEVLANLGLKSSRQNLRQELIAFGKFEGISGPIRIEADHAEREPQLFSNH